jgi:hypothetical protein
MAAVRLKRALGHETALLIFKKILPVANFKYIPDWAKTCCEIDSQFFKQVFPGSFHNAWCNYAGKIRFRIK